MQLLPCCKLTHTTPFRFPPTLRHYNVYSCSTYNSCKLNSCVRVEGKNIYYYYRYSQITHLTNIWKRLSYESLFLYLSSLSIIKFRGSETDRHSSPPLHKLFIFFINFAPPIFYPFWSAGLNLVLCLFQIGGINVS